MGPARAVKQQLALLVLRHNIQHTSAVGIMLCAALGGLAGAAAGSQVRVDLAVCSAA